MKNKSSFILAIIAFSSVISACGKPEINVDPELSPYYNKFIQNGKNSGVDLSKRDITLRFVPTIKDEQQNGVILGVCYFEDNDVEINRESWDSLSIEKREALVAHELGHCILDRDHEDSTDQLTGKKLSLMNAYLISTTDFTTKYDYYMRELFSPKDKTLLASLWGSTSSYVSPIAAKMAAIFGLERESIPEVEREEESTRVD